MAVVVCGGYNDASSTSLWNENEQWVKATYDFAVDGGAYSGNTFSLFKLPAPATANDYVITDGFLKVITAVTGTSSTIEVGYAGATAAVFAQTAEATLVENYVLTLAAKKCVTSNNTIYMTIGTANLTAGKVEFWLKIKKVK